MPDIDLHGISQAGFALIVREEDGDEAYYTRHYQHFEWPAGASGPTVGIGYDCGYVTAAELRQDWAGIVSDATIDAMARAVGLKGQAAHAFVAAHGGSVTITWDQAIEEFSARELPKWIARVKAALPGFDALPPDCKGALVSLAYNRGAGGFHDPGPRYAEMRAIAAHVAAGRLDQVPGDFLSMRRLWPQGGDLWRRRGHEAALFEQGLGKGAAPATNAAAASPPATPPAAPAPGQSATPPRPDVGPVVDRPRPAPPSSQVRSDRQGTET